MVNTTRGRCLLVGKRIRVPDGKQRVRVDTGVYLKRNGKYLATFRDPGGKQQWAEFRTREEARKWRARALLDPRSVASGKRTLDETWEKFSEHHGPGPKRTSRENWEQEWRKHIRPALGGWPVGRICVVSLKDFLADLERRGVGARRSGGRCPRSRESPRRCPRDRAPRRHPGARREYHRPPARRPATDWRSR